MNVFAVQPDIVWQDKSANLRKVRDLLAATTVPPGSLIVLPEMFATGFSMAVDAIGDGAELPFMADLARTHQSCVLGGTVTPAPNGRGRNEAAVFDPTGAEIARYGKIHPFSFGGETDHYLPGDCVVTFAWGGFTLAPAICYDLRFPELFRHAVRRGADLFAVIANWPASREAHWTALLRARAIENQAYAIGVNRCGNDPKLAYSGRSLVIDPRGETLADAGDDETVIAVDISPDAVASWRRKFPAVRDIRDDFFA